MEEKKVSPCKIRMTLHFHIRTSERWHTDGQSWIIRGYGSGEGQQTNTVPKLERR